MKMFLIKVLLLILLFGCMTDRLNIDDYSSKYELIGSKGGEYKFEFRIDDVLYSLSADKKIITVKIGEDGIDPNDYLKGGDSASIIFVEFNTNKNNHKQLKNLQKKYVLFKDIEDFIYYRYSIFKINNTPIMTESEAALQILQPSSDNVKYYKNKDEIYCAILYANYSNNEKIEENKRFIYLSGVFYDKKKDTIFNFFSTLNTKVKNQIELDDEIDKCAQRYLLSLERL